MKKTLFAKALVIGFFGFVAMTGFTAAACAEDLAADETAYTADADEIENTAALIPEDGGIGTGVALLTGAAAAAPYLTAPAAFLANTAVGLVADIFIPDNAEEPTLNPAVQVAANEED